MLLSLKIVHPRAWLSLAIVVGGLGWVPAQAQSTPQGAQLTAAAGDVQFGPPPTAAWAALVNRLHARQLESARSMGDATDIIAMALVDLDSDGYPELITTLQSIGYCGSRGCSTTIYKRGASGWTEPSILDVIAQSVSVGPPQPPGKWRTLLLSQARIWAYDGKKYVIVP